MANPNSDAASHRRARGSTARGVRARVYAVLVGLGLALVAVAAVLLLTPSGPSTPSRSQSTSSSGEWIEQIRSNLVREHHSFRRVDGAVSAIGRGPGAVRVALSDGIATVSAAAAGTGPEAFRLETSGVGRPGAMSPVDFAEYEAAPDGTTAQAEALGLREFWTSDGGLRQNWQVFQPPSGTGPLVIEIESSLPGTLQGGDVVFAVGGGAQLRYGSLRAWDATGRPLAARLVPTTVGKHPTLRVVVDDAFAAYPVTVDPLLTTSTVLEEDQADALLGLQVVGAGDVNADGYDDVLVGARNWDAGQADEGRAFLYYGGATFDTTADKVFEENTAGSEFGEGIAGIGDYNGDGFDDIVIGAGLWDDGAQNNEGRAFLYYGAVNMDTTADFTLLHPDDDAGDQFGDDNGLRGAGDLNGDGFADFVVGAQRYNVDEGRTYVYFGSATPDVTPDLTITGPAGSDLGSAAGMGDVNGDGFDDLVVGARDDSNGQAGEGRAFLYLGGDPMDATADLTYEGNRAAAEFGNFLDVVGDVNGDGYADVLIAAAMDDLGTASTYGRVRLYYGGATPNATADLTFDGTYAGGQFGDELQSIGDVNGDGYADIMIGNHRENNGHANEGVVRAYYGGPGLDNVADWTSEGNAGDTHLGRSLAGLGDVNGDGYGDVAICACRADNGEANEGLVHVHFGSGGGVVDAGTWNVEGNSGSAGANSVRTTVSDFNGDGYQDVAIGYANGINGQSGEGRVDVHFGGQAPDTAVDVLIDEDQSNARLGDAVGSGDLDADGYADLIACAYLWDHDGAPNADNEGRCFVYLGGAAMDSTADYTLDAGAQIDGQFGDEVDIADINGDGFGDVIATSGPWDGAFVNEGRAWVYLGGSVFDTVADHSFTAGAAAGDEFGDRASLAGDVNADGYPDFVATSATAGGGGRAWVYYGGDPFETTPDVTINGGGGQFGDGTGPAGDVNGDGYDDIVLGAPTAGTSNEGLAWLYLGGSPMDSVADLTFEENQDGARHGKWVAGVGDLDRDGYDDLAVGAAQWDIDGFGNGDDEGAVHIYYGGAVPDAVKDVSLLGAQLDEQMGNNVTMGDLNGDSFADVIASATRFDNQHTDEGRTSIYWGGSEHVGANTGGRSAPLTVRRGGADVTVPPGGWVHSDNAVRLRVQNANALLAPGPQRARLEWEIKPQGTPFDGTGLGRQPAYTWIGPTPVDLQAQVTGLTPSTRYQARVRLEFADTRNSVMRHSHWVEAWDSGYGYAFYTGTPQGLQAPDTAWFDDSDASVIGANPNPTDITNDDFHMSWVNQAGNDVDRQRVQVVNTPLDDVVGLWHFDGDLTDASGNGFDAVTGSAPNDASTVPSGRAHFGDALSVDSNDNTWVPGDAAFQSDGFTVDAWVKKGTVTDDDRVVQKGPYPNQDFLIQFSDSTGNLWCSVGASTSSAWVGTPYQPYVGTGWHHVACTVDDSTKQVRLYVDGVQRGGSATYVGTRPNTTNHMYVGTQETCCNRLDGDIDDLRFTDRVLDEADIRGYYLTNRPHFTSMWDSAPAPSEGVDLGSDCGDGNRCDDILYGSSDTALELEYGGARYFARAKLRTPATATDKWTGWSDWDWFETQGTTQVDSTGCQTGTADVTDFGPVVPDTPARTSDDCTIGFGSSGASTELRVYQEDGIGEAAHTRPDGALDMDHGTAGVQVDDPSSGGTDQINSVAVDDQGRIVAAGRSSGRLAVMRYLPDGTPDNAFGTNGLALVDASQTNSRAWGVAVQPDGKIVAVGDRNSSGWKIFVARFNEDGTADTATDADPAVHFNTNGYLMHNLGANDERALDVDIDAAGRAVVSGEQVISGSEADVVTMRFEAGDGDFDSSFSGDGIDTRHLGNWNEGHSVRVQDDGKIVVAGAGNWNAFVLRYHEDGTLDTGLNGTGIKEHDFVGEGEEFYGLTILDDGDYLLSGSVRSGGVWMSGIARMNDDGTLDNQCNGTGERVFQVPGASQDAADDIVVGYDGTITMFGVATIGASDHAWAWQMDDTCADDPKFGTNGLVVHDSFDIVATSSWNWDTGGAYLGDGRLVHVFSQQNASDDFATVVYDASSIPNFQAGVSDFDDGAGAFGACLRATAAGAQDNPPDTWTEAPGNDCALVDDSRWNGIPVAGTDPAAVVAETTGPGVAGATVDLRFGVRVPNTAATGSTYVAPIIVEAVSPNV